MNDLIRQRIRYLVEVGEPYPTPERRELRRLWCCVAAVGVVASTDLLINLLR